MGSGHQKKITLAIKRVKDILCGKYQPPATSADLHLHGRVQPQPQPVQQVGFDSCTFSFVLFFCFFIR